MKQDHRPEGGAESSKLSGRPAEIAKSSNQAKIETNNEGNVIDSRVTSPGIGNGATLNFGGGQK